MKQIEAVIFDWAGTIVDFGSLAPTSVFVEAFRQAHDFEISLAEARVPMGLGKWDHIRALGQLDSVSARWQAQFGAPMSDAQVDEIYTKFMPLQIAKVAQYAEPIPGVLDAVNTLKQRGIAIGSCSGYPRDVMNELVKAAATYGYTPDSVVATDDLQAGGRPGAAMALQNALNLNVKSTFCCVKVDDSAPGIEEGLNAGMWTVGITDSGNEVGLSLEQWQQLTEAEQQQRRQVAAAKLSAGGAHFLARSVAELPGIIDLINTMLAAGKRP